MSGPVRRRSVLAGLAGSAALGVTAGCPSGRKTGAPPVRFVGQTPERGHLLRDRSLAIGTPDKVVETDVLIVGGGVSGTAAAWRLHNLGADDFVLVELEDSLGGTAASGQSERSAYPTGAHYLPAPHPEFRALEALLEDVGVILGREADGTPVYDPSTICASPLERHRHRGRWFPGVYPAFDQTADEARQWERWEEHLRSLDGQRGADGRRLFALPLTASSTQLRGLANVTMASYLDGLGLDSWRLRWTIDYACRDDYGCSLDQISAFAALHHFLARGLEERHTRPILAWPGGNGHLVEAMASRGGVHERQQAGVAIVGIDPERGIASGYDVARKLRIEFRARAILWAAPRFALSHCLVSGSDPLARGALTYAPWMVANVAVSQRPGGVGAPLCWDNVHVGADHLGYVVATHGESLVGKNKPGTVLSFYKPFTAADPQRLSEARASLLGADANTLAEQTLAGLEGMHPGIKETVQSVDIARWGHAMVRAVPGLLFSETLRTAAAPIGRVYPCATDVTGLPLFEQAFSSGVTAAEAAVVASGASVQPLIAHGA